ncbi:AraC family transcriptional regulator [Vibrio rhodolitus]|uniref:AraC family transcriptional regulator n=1 Tax=Vibrio rhodolitus TaxID=2231649 RepID=UPI000E0AD140|nr:AraC family transcriptional regulator [Vibrio rhodolitus]
MANTVREINQHFWSSKTIPHLTIRTTRDSVYGYKDHSHAELSIGIIESGVTQLSMPEGKIVLNKGDVILIGPNIVHACNPVEGMTRSYQMLYIDNTWCCNVLSTLYGYKVTQYTCDTSVLACMADDTNLADLISCLIKQESQELAAELDSFLFNILSRYCSPQRAEENDDELAHKLRSTLLQDIANPPSLDIIAQEFGRPKETLIRNFKRHFGITPKSFLNNNRVEKAKCLLRCGVSIVDAATEVGFSDQSQLHRAFVSYTASTPRQYQQLTSIFDNNS